MCQEWVRHWKIGKEQNSKVSALMELTFQLETKICKRSILKVNITAESSKCYRDIKSRWSEKERFMREEGNLY